MLVVQTVDHAKVRCQIFQTIYSFIQLKKYHSFILYNVMYMSIVRKFYKKI